MLDQSSSNLTAHCLSLTHLRAIGIEPNEEPFFEINLNIVTCEVGL